MRCPKIGVCLDVAKTNSKSRPRSTSSSTSNPARIPGCELRTYVRTYPPGPPARRRTDESTPRALDFELDMSSARTRSSVTTLVKYVAAAYLVREHIAEFTICVGPSMMPTFDPNGEVALVERMFLTTTLRNRPIQKGDVVIARSVQNAKQSVCKRVMGLEGVLVTYREASRFAVDGYGRGYDGIDGRGGTSGSGRRRQVRVPKGHVFLQGDNTNNSTDSRQYGPVPYSTLQGRVVYKVWPSPGPVR